MPKATPSTFVPDGVFNTNVGHDAIVKFANTFHAGVGAHVHHWNTNLMILPTADGASGQVYLVLVDFATKPATIFTSATYCRRAREDRAGLALQEARDQGRRRARAGRRRNSDGVVRPWELLGQTRTPDGEDMTPHPSGQRVRDPRQRQDR